MKKALLRFAALASLGLILASSASAQEFQKSYQIGAGGQISVSNISGDVVVTGYDGNAVIVSAFKTGRDRDMLDIEDLSGANRVEVRVRYPKNCNCDASVRFQVQVPRSVSYSFEKLSSVSGNVEVIGVAGQLHVSAVSGDVRVKDAAGSVSASSVSGDVDVEITRSEGNEGMKFSSVSGDVNVRVPPSLGAEVDMSSFSGTIKTDFPLEVRSDRFGSKNSARGRIGDGSRNLRMSSVSGNLSLTYSSRG